MGDTQSGGDSASKTRIRQLEHELKEIKARHGNQQEELEEEQEMIINRLLRKIQQLELKITVLQERNDELSKSPKAAKDERNEPKEQMEAERKKQRLREEAKKEMDFERVYNFGVTKKGGTSGFRLFSCTMEEPAGEMACDSLGEEASDMAAAADLDPRLLRSNVSS